ncbi:hypothetical protein D3C74_235820 [compost metagenome]
MLLLAVITLTAVLLWKNRNANTRKVIVFTFLGLTLFVLLHSTLQYNTSQDDSVSVKSTGVTEKGLDEIKHKKEQLLP